MSGWSKQRPVRFCTRSIGAMRPIRPLVALMSESCMVLVSGSALAQTLSVSDPAGDGLKGHRLDITSIKVVNRDHVILATVSFVRVAHGDFLVGFKARGAGRSGIAGVSSVHRASGDTNRVRTVDGVARCKGLKVARNTDNESVRVRFPSRCFLGGDYGAVKAQSITEIGSDADFAPKTPKGNWGWTDWVSRG
jgi:hypothetical protein